MKIPCPSRTFLRFSAIQIDSSLTPFLYQTPTIQQWIAPYAPARKQRRRHASTQRDHIPLEKSTKSDGTRHVEDLTPRSTISPKEKRVFSKLLDPSYDPQAELKTRSKVPARPANRPGTFAHALNRRFTDADLRLQHEELMAAKRRHTARVLQQMEELASSGHQDAVAPPAQWDGVDPFQQQREQMLSLARLQFSRAKTDEELWELLAKWTFAIIKRHQGQAPRVDATKLTPEQLEVRKQQEANFLTYNYPVLLLAFLDELRTNFPSSQLAFTVLPMVKSLGRQSYVLGASSALYNGIILDTWRVYSDFHRINELLLEMENAGLEFDYDTLDVLEKIRRQGDRILKGERGVLLKRVWELDSIVSGWTTVVGCEYNFYKYEPRSQDTNQRM